MAFIEFHKDLVYLKDVEIANRWNTIIPEAAGRGEKLFAEIEKQVAAAGMPNVTVSRKEIETFKEGQRIKKLNPRAGLEIRPPEPFGLYEMIVGAHDYGKNLLVSRYLITHFVRASAPPFDVFEKEELAAYLSLAHHAILDAVEVIATEINQDFTKLNMKSEGIVDIS